MKRLAILLVIFCFISLGAKVMAPPTDAKVKNVLDQYKAKVDALFAKADPDEDAFKRLQSTALDGLRIAEMTPSQISMVYRARLLFVNDNREQALARLEEFKDDKGIKGAAATVLRLELLGNAFRLKINGKPWSYQPTPQLQGELLEKALTHPSLRIAIMKGNFAARNLLGALSGLHNVDLFKRHHDQIVGLQELYGSHTPIQFYLDAEDYLEVISKIVTSDDTDKIEHTRQKIVEGGKQVLKRIDDGNLNLPRE